MLAAAIVGQVDAIVTFNRGDFPQDMVKRFGIDVVGPDEFLAELIDMDKAGFVAAVGRVRARLRRPPNRRGGWIRSRAEDQPRGRGTPPLGNSRSDQRH